MLNVSLITSPNIFYNICDKLVVNNHFALSCLLISEKQRRALVVLNEVQGFILLHSIVHYDGSFSWKTNVDCNKFTSEAT